MYVAYTSINLTTSPSFSNFICQTFRPLYGGLLQWQWQKHNATATSRGSTKEEDQQSQNK